MSVWTMIGISGLIVLAIMAVTETVKNDRLERENAELRWKLRRQKQEARATPPCKPNKETIIIYGEQPNEEDEEE